MRRIDLPGLADPAAIESAVVAEGLAISLRTTLKSYPGSIHWHVTKPGSKGTLEITLWPAGNTAWVSVHANREADWIPGAIMALTG